MSNHTPSNEPPGQSNVWSEIQRVIKSIGLCPSICSSAIRTLRWIGDEQDRRKNNKGIETSDHIVEMFLKTHALRSALKSLKTKGSTSQKKNLIKEFSPTDWAHIISIFFLARKLAAKCPSPNLKPSFDAAFEYCEVAIELSQLIPKIPISDWLLVGGLRPLSLIVFGIIDEKKTVALRRALMNLKRDIFSPNREREMFGFAHTTVSAFLTQHLGLGVNRANELGKAVDKRFSSDDLGFHGNRLRIAANILDSLMIQRKMPTKGIPPAYAIPEAALKKLIAKIMIIEQEGVNASWLDPRAHVKPDKSLKTEIFETNFSEAVLKDLTNSVPEAESDSGDLEVIKLEEAKYSSRAGKTTA